MKTHIKKLTQPFFDDVWDGKKMFELRKNDCDYKVDDWKKQKLVLMFIACLMKILK